MTRSAVAAGEERILSRQCMRPDGAFDRVRVHFDAAVVERDQAGPVAYGVAYGLGCVSASASRTRQGVAAQASAGGRTAGSEASDARHGGEPARAAAVPDQGRSGRLICESDPSWRMRLRVSNSDRFRQPAAWASVLTAAVAGDLQDQLGNAAAPGMSYPSPGQISGFA